MSETRRKYSREFKIEAVRLVTEGGQGVAETARERDPRDASTGVR